jgi:hypothetical protein
MKIQIDIQKVGNTSKSGDSIAIFAQDPGINYLIIIDGGTKDSANDLMNLIIKHHKTTIVNLLVVTHGDIDHVSGAIEILKKLSVKNVACNFPWHFIDEIYNNIDNSNITKESLENNLRDRYPYLDELEATSLEKKARIHTAFSGRQAFENRPIYQILGPTQEDYISEMINVLQQDVYTQKIAETIIAEAERHEREQLTITRPDHITHPDHLTDDGYTTSTNETSVISLFNADNYKVLFTGDAGIDSLNNVIQRTNTAKIDITNADYLQVPHHGSIKCLSKRLLNLLRPQRAFISCASSDPFHPSPTVINSFHKRQIPIFTTKTSSLWLKNFPISRDGYSPALIAPFHSLIER